MNSKPSLRTNSAAAVPVATPTTHRRRRRNACVLHYVDNDKLLAEHALVLIDAGCELEGYAADITRTFPVGGCFQRRTARRLRDRPAAQLAAIAAIKPGASFSAYHDAAVRVLVQGMIDLKLLAGSVDGLIESEAYKPFYMHRTGHWLGLDKLTRATTRPVTIGSSPEPGMALTVEPGLTSAVADGPATPARHRHPHRGRRVRHRGRMRRSPRRRRPLPKSKEVMRHDG